MPEEEKWNEISVANEDKFSLEELKFILSQSEKFLKQTFDTSTTIVTRSTILLSIFVTLFVSDFAYIVNQLSTHNIDFSLLPTSIIMLFYFFYLAFRTINNIKSHDYKSIGDDPKDLLHDHFPYTKAEEKEREKYYYRFVIKDYKIRLDHNNKMNKKRWAIYNTTLRHIQYMPLVLMITYLLSFLANIWYYHICTNCHAI